MVVVGDEGVGVIEVMGPGEDEGNEEPNVFWRNSLSTFGNLNRFRLLRNEPFSNMESALG